jgi:hypothetical protein
MKRISFAIVMATFVLTSTASASAQTKPGSENARQASISAQRIPVKVTDANGKVVPVESLPADSRAQIERVRSAAESLVGQPATAEKSKVKVSVNCSWPPLKCTITVEF